MVTGYCLDWICTIIHLGSNHWRGLYTYLYDRRWGRKEGGVFGKVANPESGRHDEKLERTTTLGEREKNFDSPSLSLLMVTLFLKGTIRERSPINMSLYTLLS